MNKGKNTAKGITLIALVITIIVMLILVAVTINIALNGGLFGYAKDATTQTKSKMEAESQLSTGRIKIGDVWYDSPQDYADDKPSADQTDGGSSTGGGTQNPTQEYTWEKYSFNIATISNGVSSNVTEDYVSINSPRLNLNETTERYSTLDFTDDTIHYSGLWTGNLKEYYYCGKYLEYPFQTFVCGSTVSVLNYIYGDIESGCFSYGTTQRLHTKTFNSSQTIEVSKGSYKYGEVQSTDPTAYPQNGFKDGYWYVLKQS